MAINEIKMKSKTKQVFVIAFSITIFATAVFAAANYSLFGDAELKSPGNGSPTSAQIRSSSSIAPNYGGIDFVVPAGLTVADLDTLSTDYIFTTGQCAGGSPRFQLNVTDGTHSGNIMVYLGVGGDYNNCGSTTWTSTGNLLESSDLVETFQLPGGTYQQAYGSVQGTYGAYEVTGIQLVMDSYWANGTQTMQADNVAINNIKVTFETANSCKNGGWQNFTSSPGPFTNQGQCVSYYAKGGQ